MSKKTKTHKIKQTTKKTATKDSDFSLFGETLSSRTRIIWQVLLVASQITSLLVILYALVLRRPDADGFDSVFIIFAICAHLVLTLVSLITKHGASLLVISLASLILYVSCMALPVYSTTIQVDACEMCDGFTTHHIILNAYGREQIKFGV